MRLKDVKNPNSIITAIDTNIRFPEIVETLKQKYSKDIDLFISLINLSQSSADLLARVRSGDLTSDQRMSLLKMFRRCVSPVLDTEMTKKISKVKTEDLVKNYGDSFKEIGLLKKQFGKISDDEKGTLACLIGEYDSRGKSGYVLTEYFFNWFNKKMGEEFEIAGPTGAGRDLQLNKYFEDFEHNFPCDFVIHERKTKKLCAVGFARYDSTRGGAQSDDRTGGNSDKVSKAKEYCAKKKINFKIVFLADGPGLAHKDTWEEACKLDHAWGDNIRVVTLKTSEEQITKKWLVQWPAS